MADQNAVLVFENTEFDVVDIHNVPWLRVGQIDLALGYQSEGSCRKIYERNADEFTNEMTQVVELQTAGGIQPVRIFSPRGCYLLGMLARTEKAKAFRAWVLDVLEGRVAPVQQRPFAGIQIIAAHKHVTALMKELKRETNPAIRLMLHAQMTQACRMSSLPCPALEDIGRAEKPAADSPLLAEFWELIDILIDQEDSQQLNHSRNAGLIAINLLQVQAAARSAKLATPDTVELRRLLKHSQSPRFIEIKTVNSRHRAGSIKCWVFEQPESEEV